MVPTRELAVQVEEEARILGSCMKLKSASFYGGVGYGARYNPGTGTYARGAAAYGPYGARGYADRPASADDLGAKFLSCATRSMPPSAG